MGKYGEDIFDHTYFSDEAYIQLNGFLNSKNSVIWSAENPHIVAPTKVKFPPKLGIFVAMSRKKIIPVFFRDTVNKERYIEIIDKFLHQAKIQKKVTWFQQDSASAHTAGTTLSHLKDIFQDRVITRPLWPPRSPDLTPLDFFLWQPLKNFCFKRKPQNLDELESLAKEYLHSISPDI